MENVVWDVLVVGGGPAGMMASGRAAELGSRVLLLEKNDILGKKLLITGGGRCNVTNAELDTRKLLEKFKENGKFLFSAFSSFAVQESLDFFHIREMETKIENEKRVFPISDKSVSVLKVLVEYLQKNKVDVLSNTTVLGIETKDKKVTGVKTNKGFILAKNIILATGGISRPETGSTGDGYKWLKELGHKVTDPTPSLVPVALKDEWVKRAAGVSIQEVKITLLQNGVKQDMKKGKILFTHVGVSGPTILNMSKDIGELLKYGEVVIGLDIAPQFDMATLNTELQLIFKDNATKMFKNSLSKIVPSAMVPIVVELSGIKGETKCTDISREERIKLMNLLKKIPLHVDKLLGVEKAVITSGGVSLDEVDFKTMRSHLFPNLYLVGDILNIDRPSGGYSLQLCWTTGFVAGSSVSPLSSFS